MTPKRIQRKRTKGWKMPANTVYVGRPTKWGNPYKVDKNTDAELAVEYFETMLRDGTTECYPMEEIIVGELRGKNLACFCPLNKPCHADVLLEIANAS